MIHRFSLIERILLSNDILPHPLIDAGAVVGAAKALTSAVRLGLVDQLSDQPTPAAELARRCGLSERGVVAVLDCLDALGYVRNDRGAYALTRRGHKFLSKDSPHHFRSMLRFCDWTFASFADLEYTIRAGEPRHKNLDHFTDENWEDFARAMIELARSNVDEVTRLVPAPPAGGRVLDLGGCHGLYSVGLCRAHAGLNCEVLDLAPVRPYFDETVGAHGMSDRVRFREGDLTSADLGGGWDLVLGFNIVHGFDQATNVALAKRVHAALRPGGRYVVLDQIKEAAGASALARLTTSFMALNLLHQAGGFTYGMGDLRGWADAAGFGSVTLKKLRAPGFGLAIFSR